MCISFCGIFAFLFVFIWRPQEAGERDRAELGGDRRGGGGIKGRREGEVGGRGAMNFSLVARQGVALGKYFFQGGH